MRSTRCWTLAAAGCAFWANAALAQLPPTLRIGVLTDFAGSTADSSGQGQPVEYFGQTATIRSDDRVLYNLRLYQ